MWCSETNEFSFYASLSHTTDHAEDNDQKSCSSHLAEPHITRDRARATRSGMPSSALAQREQGHTCACMRVARARTSRRRATGSCAQSGGAKRISCAASDAVTSTANNWAVHGMRQEEVRWESWRARLAQVSCILLCLMWSGLES